MDVLLQLHDCPAHYTVSVTLAVMHTLIHSSEGIGEVTYDLGYGGAFYALVDVTQLKMDLKLTPVQQLERTATAIKETIM